MIVTLDDQVFDYLLYQSRIGKAEKEIQPFLNFMAGWNPGKVQ